MMHNCKMNTLRGYSYSLPNSIINCSQKQITQIIMPLANSLQSFDGKVSTPIRQTKRNISAIDIRLPFIVVGQKANPGQLISAILFRKDKPQIIKVFNYQKTQIKFISVSLDGRLIASIGSSTGNIQQFSIIQTENQSKVGTRVFYSKKFGKKQGGVVAIKFSNCDPNFLVIMCLHAVIFCRIDIQNQSVEQFVAKTSKVRQYTNFIFSPDDKFIYTCSRNGDVSQISVQQGRQMRIGPRKRVITKGILNIKFLHPNYLIISGNEGLMAKLDLSDMKMLKQIKLQNQQIVGITEFVNGQGFISTSKATIYKIKGQNLQTSLFYTCHSTTITCVTFLKDFPQLVATSAGSEIIIWHTETLEPALKIAMPKGVCLSICLPKSGKYILSGWSDGFIRIFSPKNGKLINKIQANMGQVLNIITDIDAMQLIAGGSQGVIRMWNLVQSKNFGLIIGSLAFHSNRVHCLRINPFQSDQLVSCGEDGKIAVWSLSKFQLRRNYFICNFIKQIHFVSENKVRAAGGGCTVYQFMINDGYILKQVQLRGTCINSLSRCHLQSTAEQLLFVGTDLPYLDYIDLSASNQTIISCQTFGAVNKIAVSNDNSKLIAATENGIILYFSIYGVKNENDQ